MQALEGELEALQCKRNEEEYQARNWRELANEVFAFARYTKEDFESDNLEKQRTVVAKLGLNLTILDRTIQLTPNKYFVPIENINQRSNELKDMVRTENKLENNAQKSKNTPVGVPAILDESTSSLDLNSSWLRLQVTNSSTGVERYKSDTVCIELDRNNNKSRGGVAMSVN